MNGVVQRNPFTRHFELFLITFIPRSSHNLGENEKVRDQYMLTRTSRLDHLNGCLTKTPRRIISLAAMMGTTVLLNAGVASAQSLLSPDCLPGSPGPTTGSTAPYTGGMCDLGTLRADNASLSQAHAINLDGTVIVGNARDDANNMRAFRWIGDGTGMRDLGTLRADNSGDSYVQSLSSDGTVIVGNARNDDAQSYGRAFRWVDDGNGMRDLGSLRTDNSGSSYARAVSADGAVIVGDADSDLTSRQRAFRWIDDGNGMRDLGSLRTDNLGSSYARAVSADGAVITGDADTDDGSHRVFRQIGDGNGMLDLGTLRADNSGNSYAQAISADGAVIVGDAATEDGSERAFRWINDGNGMRDLGSLRTDRSGFSRAQAVSADGAVIVGNAETEDGSERAFRWINDGSGMRDLGSLRADNLGFSLAEAVSADGIVIVGAAETDDNNFRAFRWIDDGTGMLDLGTLRADSLGTSQALAISEDGSTIVGLAETDDQTQRAFIWRAKVKEPEDPQLPVQEDPQLPVQEDPQLPVQEDPQPMQDFANLLLSFPVLANDTQLAIAQQQAAMNHLMDATCLAEAGQSCLSAGVWYSHTAANSASDIGSQRNSSISITYGRGIDGQTTVGGTLSYNGPRLSNNGFSMDSAPGISLWAEYSESGLARTGLQAATALGWSRETGASISRGRGIENVTLARGKADIVTTGVHATLGYGFERKDWLITPNATLSHFRSSRSAYSEIDAVFSATYDELSVNRTTLTLEVGGERKLSAVGTLLLKGGFDHDFNADKVILTGTSDIPGMMGLAAGSTLKRNKTRGFVSVGYAYDLGGNRALTGSVRVEQSPYGNESLVGAGISFSMRF